MNIFESPKPNTFKNTFCIFKETTLEEVPAKKVDYVSKSGSSYYYTPFGMYRLSNHWGRLANSKWRLEPMIPETTSKMKLGFALWTDFYPDNTSEELYYIEVNFDKRTVNYQHKNNPEYNQKAILRTSFETTKKIKQIRNLLNLISWAKHFDYTVLDDLRKQIITELIHTNKSLEDIKRSLHEQK